MEPIRIWKFTDAPQVLQELSPHGGDEDWLALVPWPYSEQYIGWLESGGSFGCCDVSEHKLEGAVVYIGAHS